MPIQTDAPTGIGSPSLWGLWGSASDMMDAVATNDGDTKVIYGVSGGRLTTQLYTFPAIAGVTDPVTAASLGIYARKYANGVGGQAFYGLWNSSRTGTNLFPTLTFDSYALNTVAAATLTLAAVNGQHGFETWAAGGPRNPVEIWVTQFYRTVNYSFIAGTTGDFGYLIGSLVGALVGSNLLLSEMPALARAMARVWRKGQNLRLRADELEPAWRAWRGSRFPTYCFGGLDALES